MKPTILHVNNHQDMDELVEILSESKYSIEYNETNYILLKKKNYGNLIIHGIFILIGLFLNVLAFILNVIYFSYCFFKKSNILLITTDTIDIDGNPVEFDKAENLEIFYSQEKWDRAIELTKYEKN